MNISKLVCGVVMTLWVAGCGAKDTQKIELAERGGRGESCQARNDCAAGLACIGGVCSQNDFPIQVTAKQCDVVECKTKEDCCDSRTTTGSSYCVSLKSACDAGDSTSCADYASTCTCRSDCKDSKCVNADTCAADSDCFNSSRNFCVAGQCAACKVSTDCGATGQCVGGTCKAGCTRNEQCPFFSTCQTGQCVETGCQSDRECFGATGSALSRCADKKCRVPCQTDGECGEFQACDQGACVFVGCESDDQCRYFLGVESQTGVYAVCR